jgi:hypothetical protein
MQSNTQWLLVMLFNTATQNGRPSSAWIFNARQRPHLCPKQKMPSWVFWNVKGAVSQSVVDNRLHHTHVHEARERLKMSCVSKRKE